VTTSLGPERRAALLGTQLRAVASAQDAGAEAGEVSSFAAGAGLRTPTATWVLLSPSAGEERADRTGGTGFGAVLAWATQGRSFDSQRIRVVVAGEASGRAGAIAHQASHFLPAPDVWTIRGRDLVAAAPEPPAPPPEPAPAALALLDQLRAAGLDAIVEHGVVRGEIAGLEVAVVVVDDTGAARIEVGVGRNDREAFGLLHGDLPPAEAMAKVADTVRRHRRADAISHPLNRMAPERWLRSRLLADPDRLVGWNLAPVPGPVRRAGVADAGPAFAYGHDENGEPVVLACSVGIDVELVPTAADARAAIDASTRLVLAVPERDAHPVTARLAAALSAPAELLAVPGDWRR
jgi:hypothetical protein